LVGGPAGRDRGGEDSELRDGRPRTTTGVSQRWFSGHFQQVFFNANALPRINIGADVWGKSGKYKSIIIIIIIIRCLVALVLV
jgi:hypothetical protein